MSIDSYYIQIDKNWVLINYDYVPDFATDFWVDICHGKNFLIDERYYFADLASALDFYREGWKERQYLDDNGTGVGLDHKGLYSQGRLIDGLTIHGDPPGHEGESLRQIMDELVKALNQRGHRRGRGRRPRP